MVDLRKVSVGRLLSFLAIPTLIAAFTVYAVYGDSLIEAAYGGESFRILNEQIRGQGEHSVEYYQRLASDFFFRIWTGIALGVGTALWIRMASAFYATRHFGRRTLVWVVSLPAAVALTPPVFERAFAVGVLFPVERRLLWLAPAGLLVCCWVVSQLPRRQTVRAAAVLGELLLLVGCELTVRYVVNFFPTKRIALVRLADMTHPERLRYSAHPLLQFTGTPASTFAGSLFRERATRYNSLGFRGREFTYRKTSGLIRVACLGASTTESGYPQRLEEFLNTNAPEGVRFEVLNFGIAGWNSGHSLVNFVLNVRDFSPDFVVVHHGGNEGTERSIGPADPGDYSYRLKPFEPRVASDRLLIRTSAIYRYIRNRIDPMSSGLMLENAVLRDADSTEGINASDTIARSHFERNLRTMTNLALVDESRVVLTTVPYARILETSTSTFLDIEKSNETIRELVAEYRGQITLVDLDKVMSGRMEHLFLDVAHVNNEGRVFKAQQIGQVILDASESQ